MSDFDHHRRGSSGGSSGSGARWGLAFSLVSLAIFGIVTCAMAFIFMDSVDKGQIGIYSVRPMFFGKAGVSDDVVIGPARAYMAPTTGFERVNIAPESLVVHADDFMSRDRVPLDFDVSITIQLADAQQAPAMYRKFGGNHIETFKILVLQNTEKKTGAAGEFMSYLRDQVRHYHSSIFVNAQTEDGQPSDDAKKVEDATTKYINDFLAARNAGMVKVTNIALGRANPPPGVRQAIERTAEQAQDQKTQAERKKAAEQRKAAEIATADADLAYTEKMGLSGDQFVALKQIETLQRVCGVDRANCYVSLGNGQMAVAAPGPTIRTRAAAAEQK